MNKKQVASLVGELKQKNETSGGLVDPASEKNISKAFKQDGFRQDPEILRPPTSRRTKATVRVMLSNDFCHFEESIELTGEDIPLSEIDNARKDCQRLADKAVGQYKTAKAIACKRTTSSYERLQLENEVAAIKQKKEEYLTPDDKAKIKALADYEHRHRYDYDDDIEYRHQY
jgi:hypothetical protein